MVPARAQDVCITRHIALRINTSIEKYKNKHPEEFYNHFSFSSIEVLSKNVRSNCIYMQACSYPAHSFLEESERHFRQHLHSFLLVSFEQAKRSGDFPINVCSFYDPARLSRRSALRAFPFSFSERCKDDVRKEPFEATTGSFYS